MRELVFLLEEASAKAMLQSLLPRFLDARIQQRLIAFEGKQDLERQMVRRIKGYANPSARFIVLRDQDSTPDCRIVKNRLLGLCAKANRQATYLVRVACHELESFYLADLSAVEISMGLTGLARRQRSARFRSSDQIEKPSLVLARLTNGKYQKVSGSRQLGAHLDLDNQGSVSFKNLILGIRKLEQELLALHENN